MIVSLYVATEVLESTVSTRVFVSKVIPGMVGAMDVTRGARPPVIVKVFESALPTVVAKEFPDGLEIVWTDVFTVTDVLESPMPMALTARILMA